MIDDERRDWDELVRDAREPGLLYNRSWLVPLRLISAVGAELDRLRAENERLRHQLAGEFRLRGDAGRGPVRAPF